MKFQVDAELIQVKKDTDINIVEKFQGMVVIACYKKKDNDVFAVVGNVGNRRDDLLVALAGVEKEPDEVWIYTVERANKIVKFISEKELNEMTDEYDFY